jgi:hypothetical protein
LKLSINKTPWLLALSLCVSPARAGGDLPAFKLALKGGQFVPAALIVPSGVKFKLVIANEDADPAEFESFVLHREQVVVGHSEAAVFLGPLKPGRYEFFNDFHPKTRGWLEVADPGEKKK